MSETRETPISTSLLNEIEDYSGGDRLDRVWKGQIKKKGWTATYYRRNLQNPSLPLVPVHLVEGTDLDLAETLLDVANKWVFSWKENAMFDISSVEIRNDNVDNVEL